MRIVIPSDQTRTVTSRKTGRTYLVQRAGLVQSDGLAQSFDVLLNPERGDRPYPAGEYSLAQDCIYVDRAGRLSVSTKFVPVPAAAKPKAA